MKWHQMLYGSADGGHEHAGGWGVLAASESIPASLRAFMESRVVTRIESDQSLDEFSPQWMLDERVRCLSFSHDPDAGAVWWHAVEAGKDVTGRPGNVITHVLGRLDIDPQSRPIHLWSAPGWLQPFGHREVASARLAEFAFQAPGDARAAALRRAFDAGERTEGLLAAVAACFSENRPLALVGSTDDAIKAIEVISWCTAAAVCRTLPFASFVRGASLPAPGAPFQLLCVPRSDLAEALSKVRDGETMALVVDLEGIPEQPRSDRWELDGQQWDVDRVWQDAFFTVSELSFDAALALLCGMDEICVDLNPRELMHPSWPMALSVLRAFGEDYVEASALQERWRALTPWDDLQDVRLRELLGQTSYGKVADAETEQVVAARSESSRRILRALEDLVILSADCVEPERSRVIAAVRVGLGLGHGELDVNGLHDVVVAAGEYPGLTKVLMDSERTPEPATAHRLGVDQSTIERDDR